MIVEKILMNPSVLASEESLFYHRRLKKDILVSVLQRGYFIWKFIPVEVMLEEDAFLHAAVASNPFILAEDEYCHLQNQEHIALHAAERHTFILGDQKYAQLLSHREVVLFLASTERFPWSFIIKNFPQYRSDKEIVLSAVSKCAYFIEDCDLKDDKDVVLVAVRQTASSFQYASERLRGDLEVVTIASRSDPAEVVLRFASDHGKSNPDVVLAAVTMNGRNLRYASEAVRNMERVVLAAISNYPRGLVFTGQSQRRNLTVLKAASDPAWAWDLGICPVEWGQGDTPLKVYIIDILHRIDARGHYWPKYALDESHNPTRLGISAQAWIRYAWEKIFVLGHIQGLDEITHLRREMLNFVPELRIDIQNFEELLLCEDIINRIIRRGSPAFLARLRLEVYPMYTFGGRVLIRDNHW